jgi:hypothetical protein
VYQHWADLARQRGEVPTGIMGPKFVLTLPDGESYGDFAVKRFPALRTEIEGDMVPRVENAVTLVRAFAAASGRHSGEIEQASIFVCDDGRQIPIARCTFHQLWTDKDYTVKLPGRKKPRC